MALEYVKLGLALVFVTILCELATAQSGCSSVLLGLAPCLNYIMGSSTTPASSCCSQLSSVVQSQPQCLCSALKGGGSSFGITINQTKALSLPGACKVQTPPVSRCNGASGPAAVPLSSAVNPTADSSDETPDTPATSSSMPIIPSGRHHSQVPAKEGYESNGSSMKTPLALTLVIFIFIFEAFYVN
ncbi:hypothetical protein F3Y22_tig00112614pilonHSYRG00046 [Hibiscus syriacus]|uniref:Bifunctional inhibitor/plant lipid transfer protein/seed storage helical domain-containing protein n=1 Tax=Hibiscus syriacus TaxID=106335 RepID=A0A6A2XDX6_HIBSY|nr:non-specific lipid transfer protein GPI-anchored 19-like [Hibiscus syriacus]KAE8665435.1 hypothetical protein F3Y22_tig00112614pilonHSYRG00046 [Hibiscus syriacus]